MSKELYNNNMAERFEPTNEFAKLLAEQSIRDGEQRYTEADIRAMVGAPSREEEEMCMCGKHISQCPDAYDHMTHGY